MHMEISWPKVMLVFLLPWWWHDISSTVSLSSKRENPFCLFPAKLELPNVIVPRGDFLTYQSAAAAVLRVLSHKPIFKCLHVCLVPCHAMPCFTTGLFNTILFILPFPLWIQSMHLHIVKTQNHVPMLFRHVPCKCHGV